MKKTLIVLFVPLLLFAFVSAAGAADAPSASERYVRSYSIRDFKLNQDSLKYEVPENAAYRITPRLKKTEVLTSFGVPQESQGYLEWVATAIVRGSDGPAAGIGLWGAGDGYVLYLFPDGSGAMRQYQDKKSVWSKEIKIANFAYPANLTLWRDANGSVIAKVDGVVVAARLFDVDVKAPKTPKITSVSFVTRSSEKVGGSVFYEKLDIEAWGTKGIANLFKE